MSDIHGKIAKLWSGAGVLSQGAPLGRGSATVYILTFEMPYEGAQIEGVYASFGAAVKEADRLSGGNWHKSDYQIRPWPVEGEVGR